MVTLRTIEGESYIKIEESVLDAIYEEALRVYPWEGGGFLFGNYSEDRTVVYVRRILKPLNMRATGMSFERVVDKKTFETIYDEEGLIYVGEWHSHPNGSSLYSSMDKQAMIRIAEYPKTLIEHPLLMIVGVKNRRVQEYSVYMYDNQKLLRYEQSGD